MKEIFEAAAAAPRFNMRALYRDALPRLESHPQLAPHLEVLRRLLPASDYQLLVNAILRNAYLIEPMLKRGGATKTQVRWLAALEGDQRYCSFEECEAIAGDLVRDLAHSWLNRPEHFEALTLSLNYRMISHEASFDYAGLFARDDTTTRIHRRGNLRWVCTPETLKTLRLRRFVIDPSTSPDAAFFRKVLEDKIKTKAYLTDRVQTGLHQTNREKRWETHPHSVHFATRQMGMAIEYKLLTQLCAFEGFPDAARATLQAQNILPEHLEVFRCPITLEPLSYEQFHHELMNPVHGRSSFQVAHLNPLKLDDPASAARGQMAENISWMTADGNRIQGSMGLTEIRRLLVRVARNYEEAGVVDDEATPLPPPNEPA